MNSIILTLLAILGIAGNGHPDPMATAATEGTYCNARFGYCINYPEASLVPQEEAQNGDGRKFTNKKGEVILTVFGRLSMDADGERITLAKQYANDLAELQKASTITYKKMGRDFYVISGERKGRIFYHKMIVKEDAFCFALLEYGNAEKALFDPYAGVVFKTFK